MMGSRVSTRLLWLAVIANILFTCLMGAAGTALAQGNPGQLHKNPEAPTAYDLRGDTVNRGTSITVFSTTNTSPIRYGFEFLDENPFDATLHAYGAEIGVQAEGSTWGISGAGGRVGVNGVGGEQGVFGTSFSGYGVYGRSELDRGVHGSGKTYGVYGTAATGVYGTGTSYGVTGNGGPIGVYGNGSTYGVQGSSNNSGVYGAGNNRGVYGYGGNAGIEGESDSAAGVLGHGPKYGVRGYTTGDAASYGGFFSATDGTGVSGRSNTGRGVHGESGSSFGLYGKSNSGIGLYGFSSSNIGLYGQTATGNYALYAVNPSTAPTKYAGFFEGNVRINGNLTCSAGCSLAAAVQTDAGERLLYADASAQSYISDQGTATLKDGRAVIKIDPLFAQTVSLDAGYMVLLTPGSFDSLGLAFGSQTADGFEVRELNGGKGSYSFVWRITALRKGYEKQRMEPAPDAPPLDEPAGGPLLPSRR